MTVRVKVCGVRRVVDVAACIRLGVDFIGFNFWAQSPRYVDPAGARELAAALPATTRAVGVFVGATPERVTEIVREVGLHAVQLHGDEDLSLYRGVPADIIQVVRLRDDDSAPAPEISASATRVLLDAHVEGYGGAGRTFDWGLVEALRNKTARDLLIAGGLTPENVGGAIEIARPWGVDVASGVEEAPGIKDPDRLSAFVDAARAAASRIGGASS